MSTNNVHPIFDGLLSAIDSTPTKSKLEQLLDERWPLTEKIPSPGTQSERLRKKKEKSRQIFTEGYNAAIQDAGDCCPSIDDSGREGCFYSDTEYDSPAVVYGYNLAISHFTDNLAKIQNV